MLTISGYRRQIFFIVLFCFFTIQPFYLYSQDKLTSSPKDTLNKQEKITQAQKSKEGNLIKINSTPSGAIVHLKGLYSIVGRTPFVVPYPIEGHYKIKAVKEGYESETTYIDILGDKESQILIRLSPKSRFKSAVRSLAFPGWGQIYSGDKVRGVIISTIQIALGIRTLFAINDYNDSKDALNRALAQFERNKDEDSFQNVQEKLIQAQNDFDFRKTMFIVTAGFWIYNVIDSIVFFSSPEGKIELKTSGQTNNLTNPQINVSWKINF